MPRAPDRRGTIASPTDRSAGAGIRSVPRTLISADGFCSIPATAARDLRRRNREPAPVVVYLDTWIGRVAVGDWTVLPERLQLRRLGRHQIRQVLESAAGRAHNLAELRRLLALSEHRTAAAWLTDSQVAERVSWLIWTGRYRLGHLDVGTTGEL